MSSLASLPNPFEGTVVPDAWAAPAADVADIHRGAFDACLAALDSARRGHSDSVLVYGPAGSGKTHLLARLQRRLLVDVHDSPDHALHCVFVAAKLQTSSTLLWQLVRRRLATDLMRRHEGVTQLQRLVAHQLAAADARGPRFWVLALRVLTTSDVAESVTEYLEQVAQRLELDRDVFVALEHLVHNRYVTDATAWLRGDSLPETVLDRLGLGRDELDDREEAARRVVTTLCRLAGATLPIVFCFDQVEALQSHPEDTESLFRFGRMAADLAESDDNVLLISCVQSAFLERLNANVRDADRDRIFKRQTMLDPLTREQVGALVRCRLDALEPLRLLRVGVPEAPYFPFDDGFVASLAARTPCLPRRVIAASAARFEELQRDRPSAPIDRVAFLQAAFAERQAASLENARPEESRDALVHGLPMLWALRHRGSVGKPALPARADGPDLILGAGADAIGVEVCNETNMAGLAARLRRLSKRSTAGLPDSRLVILRDVRLPISRGAKKTKEYLAELEQRGVHFVQPSVEALAALEALRSLVSDARAGDLNARGETIAESVVVAWLATALEPELSDLIEDVAGQGSTRASTAQSAEPELVRDLADLMSTRHLAALAEVARDLHRSDGDVLKAALSDSRRFGILQGPPIVLFAHVPAESLAAKADSLAASAE